MAWGRRLGRSLGGVLASADQEVFMASDVIDFGEHQRRIKTRPFGPLRGRYSRPFGQMPIAIMRIYQLMLDAPEDPPLVK